MLSQQVPKNNVKKEDLTVSHDDFRREIPLPIFLPLIPGEEMF